MRALWIALAIAASEPAHAAPPDHLVMMVFDAMRPDYVDRFDLKQFKRLRRLSREYVNAYVGHMGAETVVSHLVLGAGRSPKDLPWQDEVFIDHDGVLGEKGKLYPTGSLDGAQYDRLMSTLPPETFIAARVKKKHGGRVFSVAEKYYAAFVFGSPAADAVITMKKADGRCTPVGRAVPSWVTENPRYALECRKAYGTESSFYPIDGSRLVPGDDPAHLGGDVWVADIGLEIMEREQDWSVLMLSFGGIDKIAHLGGEQDGPMQHSFTTEYTLERIARVADVQLGRILDALEKKKLLDRTVIVATADHGGQSNKYYFGVGASAKIGLRGGPGALPLSPWIHRLQTQSKVREVWADSAIRVWLADDSKENVAAATGVLREISGVVEVYGRAPGGYTRLHARWAGQPAAARKWGEAHNAELVGTMAGKSGPDLIALLADNVGFDLLGDHGGAQEKVQRIPLFIRAPAIGTGRSSTPARLRDVAGLISPSLGIE